MQIIQKTKKENYEKNNLDGLFLLIGGKDSAGDFVILADSLNPYALKTACGRSFDLLMKRRKIIFC